jgi:hypothetical protein
MKRQLRLSKLPKYKPDASGYLLEDPYPSLARRACIETLRISKFTVVLSRKMPKFISNVKLQNFGRIVSPHAASSREAKRIETYCVSKRNAACWNRPVHLRFLLRRLATG